MVLRRNADPTRAPPRHQRPMVLGYTRRILSSGSQALGHRLIRGTFPALEPHLFRLIADLQQSDPLRAVDVLVTSNLLGVHLRRRYLEWREQNGLAPAHAAISFWTIDAFATELAGPGAPPLPEFGDFALLSDALATLPEARVFGTLASRPD